MSIGGTDLNLLLPLKVLLEEGHVTRAGARLNLSQPAMSTSLARLRRRFDDELLVRSGRDYELTPFARALLPEVQKAVRLLEGALDLDDDFDPTTSERTFQVTMSDYAIAVMHQPLFSLIEAEAPGVRLDIRHLGPEAIASHEVLLGSDAVIAPLGLGFPGQSKALWRDRMVVLADRSNSRLAGGRLTLTDLTELEHAVADFGPGTHTPVDRIFGELDIERRVALRVFGFLPLTFVVEGSDLVAVLPERLANLHVGNGSSLVAVDPPFGHVSVAEGYFYMEDRLSDSAYRWLFGRLDEAGAAVAAGGAAVAGRADL